MHTNHFCRFYMKILTRIFKLSSLYKNSGNISHVNWQIILIVQASATASGTTALKHNSLAYSHTATSSADVKKRDLRV